MFWVSSRQEEATQILLRKYDAGRNNIYGEENIIAGLVRPSLTSRQKGRVYIWCGIKLRGLGSVQMDNNGAGSSQWWRDGLITYRHSQKKSSTQRNISNKDPIIPHMMVIDAVKQKPHICLINLTFFKWADITVVFESFLDYFKKWNLTT